MPEKKPPKRTAKKPKAKKKAAEPELGPAAEREAAMPDELAQDYDDPTAEESMDSANEDLLDEEAESEWDEPSEGAGAETAASDALDEDLEEAPESLLEIHSAVEQLLESQVLTASQGETVAAEDALEGSGNIVGVSVGTYDEGAFDGPPGEPCLNLYVAEPCSTQEARAVVSEATGVSAAADSEVPVNVVVTGPIDALSHRFKIRPAPGGVSCGHVRVTAGTLGCLARGRSGKRRRRKLILSNNHILANSNNARFGDSIIQPGRADGGRSPRDRIAILERLVPINFAGGGNYVDCATGWAWHKRVRKELLYLRGGQRRFFRISSRPVRCRTGMTVGKTGRTTQLKAGRITSCRATIRVGYGGGKVALFKDQIAIRGLAGRFSAGGDSGSVIWTWNRRRNPVGLLFAGGGGLTFANKIPRVLAALKINLVT